MVKMSLQKTDSDALAIVEFKSNVKSKPAPKVLDEDAYTEVCLQSQNLNLYLSIFGCVIVKVN